jgi:ABC-type sugar transport system ATPase subunit
MDELFRLADRISILRDGRLVRTLDRAQTNRREVTHLMVGREIEEIDFAEPRRYGDVILEVKQLSLAWPGHARAWRLNDISFRLRRGEILGIAGLMGAGRTELLECLFGASRERPKGQILLDDRLVRFRNPRDARRAGVAMVTEDRKRWGLFPQLVVRENISICTLGQTGPAGLVHRRRERARVGEVMRQLAIRAVGGEAPIGSLSGGNQQKTIIGRWLLTRPKVLLLDDPTRGVDVGAKAELYRLMDHLCREGLGIILTSSELPELLTVCDRILVLSEGRLTAEFTHEEATEQKIMEAATG